MIAGEVPARAWLELLPEWEGHIGELLEAFVTMLFDENTRQNLVSRTSLASVWQRHMLDSAQLLRFVPRETQSWLDLGTGAGFPGLVIAMLRSTCQVTLVESRARRSDWLMRAAEALGLGNVRIAAKPVEQVAEEKFGVISARAFAPLDKLLALSARFSTSDTIWVLPKGRSAAQELCDLHGWQHMFHVEQSLSDPDAGIIVGTLAGRKGRTS